MPRTVSNRAGMEAGRREFPIIIESLTDDTAESNFPTEEWTPMTRVFASREFVSLDERATGSQMLASSVVRWTIPYSQSMDPDRVDVAKTRRLKYLERVYPIVSAEPLPRGEGHGIVLVTEAKVG